PEAPDDGDPSGTLLSATRPIGVFTGHTSLMVASPTSPAGIAGQSSVHQQLPPNKALGNEYVAPGIVSRLSGRAPESVPYRLLGVVDGTALTYDPSPPPGAPTALDAGQVAEFFTTNLFVVRSQDGEHPFSMTQYMPCSPEDSVGNDFNDGGPDWMA